MMNNSFLRDLNILSSEITKTLKSSASKEKLMKTEFDQALAAAKQTKAEDLKVKLNCNTQSEELLKKGNLDIKNWTRLQCLVEKSESDYKIAIQNQQYTDKLYYEYQRDEMEKLEKLDKRRVELIKRIMTDYRDMMVEISKTLKERNKFMRACFENIDPKREIQEFTLSVKTGVQREEPHAFEPYVIRDLK